MNFVKYVGENTIVKLSGKLDNSNATILMEELKTLVGKGIKRMDYYCAGLEYISNAGIRAMLFSKQKIDNSQKVDIFLHNTEPFVKDILDVSGMENHFKFVD